MAKTNAVSAAIGTQRQFAKQPEAVYQKSLKEPQVGAGISARVDLDAKQLAQSLGVLGKNLFNESVAMDKRMREQFTTEDAERMLAGKTEDDLRNYNTIMELQHSGKDFDLSDNPYAIAALDMSRGRMAALSAREKYLSDNIGVPKSINEAVQGFNDTAQEQYKSFKDSISNKYAFDKGFNQLTYKGALDVAEDARKRITAERKSQGQRSINIQMQDILANSGSLEPEVFTSLMGEQFRELAMYCSDSDEALKIIYSNLDQFAETSATTAQIDAIKDLPYFGDRKLGDELPLSKIYKKIANNFDNQLADTIYENCKRANGTIDWSQIDKVMSSLPVEAISGGIPKVNLPIADGDIENLSPTLKSALPFIGGLLAQAGYGDVAEFTSGYRSPEYNASVQGAPNSWHTKGNAVDVYVGDLDDTAQDNLLRKFKPYFGEVLYHDAGSGLHLHLGNYFGGLDGQSSHNGDTSASAYSPDRKEHIMRRLEAIDSDKKRIANQQHKDLQLATFRSVMTAESEDAAINAVRSSELPYDEQEAMIRKIHSTYKERDKAALTAEDNYYIGYERNRLWHDLDLMETYNQRLEDPEDSISEKEQEKYNKAAHNLNKYYKWANKGTATKTESPSTPTKTEQPTGDQKETKESLLADLKQQVAEARGGNYSDIELMQMVMDWADDNGISAAEALGASGLYN